MLKQSAFVVVAMYVCQPKFGVVVVFLGEPIGIKLNGTI